MRARPRALPLIAVVAALGACSTPTDAADRPGKQDKHIQILLDTSPDTTDTGRGGNMMGSGH